MTSLLANTGLMIVLGIILATAVVLGLIALLMKKSGASMKPLLWFAGFMGLVTAPQLAGHLYNSFALEVDTSVPAVSGDSSPAATSAEQWSPEALFGELGRDAIVSQESAQASGVLSGARNPAFIVLKDGRSVFLGRFPVDKRAQEAVTQYLSQTGLAERAAGDVASGYFAVRGPSDFVHVRAFGNLFAAISGADEAAIQEVLRSPGFLKEIGVGASVPASSSANDKSPVDRLISRVTSSTAGIVLLVGALGAYLLVIAFYFFKGATWAARVDASSGTAPLTEMALKARLKEINEQDAPFRIETDERTGDIIAIWRYADARWIEVAGARGMKRVHKIVMRFDPEKRSVLATDFAASHDWAAGVRGGSFEWRAALGIVFFQYEHFRVFGLQVDSNGKLLPVLSYAYTFNLQEMKAPLIASVTRSGWSWTPVPWHAPSWLRWLTG